MQFGIFSVGDVTTDPTSAWTSSPPASTNPPFVPSCQTTLLGYLSGQTETLKLSTATTLITTNDPVKIAEDYAMLQHLSGGRVDLMMGRGTTGPVYPWFCKDIRDGIPLAVENHLLRRFWRERVVNWEGQFRTPLQGYTSTPLPPGRHPAVRLARLDSFARDR